MGADLFHGTGNYGAVEYVLLGNSQWRWIMRIIAGNKYYEIDDLDSVINLCPVNSKVVIVDVSENKGMSGRIVGYELMTAGNNPAPGPYLGELTDWWLCIVKFDTHKLSYLPDFLSVCCPTCGQEVSNG